LNFWAPQMVKSLSSGYSNSRIGLLLVIPNLVGLAGMIFFSRSSDRTLERRYHVAIPAITGGVALVMLGTTHSPFFFVPLLSLALVGTYGFLGPFWALPSEFLTGFSAAAGIALINSVGHLGGFVGPYAIGLISQRTGSLFSGLALAGISLFVSATLALLLPKRARAYTG
jgi:ACS family tartrate transporter-like MFS transporter